MSGGVETDFFGGVDSVDCWFVGHSGVVDYWSTDVWVFHRSLWTRRVQIERIISDLHFIYCRWFRAGREGDWRSRRRRGSLLSRSRLCTASSVIAILLFDQHPPYNPSPSLSDMQLRHDPGSDRLPSPSEQNSSHRFIIRERLERNT